jgi:glycosyltransferase involved in cell wall biosynthesis
VSSRAPLVSVVTPFYNTAAYLDACIRSVLAQSWHHFEYLLVNNRSTDGSAELARVWACRDPRIRVVDQSEFLGQVENYNSALEHIDPESKYVKIVQADDWLNPECLAQMVAVGEQDPSVVIVGSYYLAGDSVLFTGIPTGPRVHDGREVCRRQLLWRNFFMGNPTTLLYRAACVRSRRPFFETGRFHEDCEVCFDLLRTGQLGFVPQVLSFVRVDNESVSITGARRDYDWRTSLRYTMVRRYGPHFLSAAEYAAAEATVTRQYWWRLVRAAVAGRGAAYFAFHRSRLAEVGELLSGPLLVRWPCRFGLRFMARAARAIRRRLRGV